METLKDRKVFIIQFSINYQVVGILINENIHIVVHIVTLARFLYIKVSN